MKRAYLSRWVRMLFTPSESTTATWSPRAARDSASEWPMNPAPPRIVIFTRAPIWEHAALRAKLRSGLRRDWHSETETQRRRVDRRVRTFHGNIRAVEPGEGSRRLFACRRGTHRL